MMRNWRSTGVLLATALALAAAGCAGASTGDASTGDAAQPTTAPSSAAAPGPTEPTTRPTVGPAPTSVPTTPAPRRPSPRPIDPSPKGGKGLELTGTVTAGVEGGCLMLDGYLLLNPNPRVVRPGARVRVTGEVRTDMVTTCQQGTPFMIETAEPA